MEDSGEGKPLRKFLAKHLLAEVDTPGGEGADAQCDLKGFQVESAHLVFLAPVPSEADPSVHVVTSAELVVLHLKDIVEFAHEPYIAFLDVLIVGIAAEGVDTYISFFVIDFHFFHLRAAGLHHVFLVVAHLLSCGGLSTFRFLRTSACREHQVDLEDFSEWIKGRYDCHGEAWKLVQFEVYLSQGSKHIYAAVTSPISFHVCIQIFLTLLFGFLARFVYVYFQPSDIRHLFEGALVDDEAQLVVGVFLLHLSHEVIALLEVAVLEPRVVVAVEQFSLRGLQFQTVLSLFPLLVEIEVGHVGCSAPLTLADGVGDTDLGILVDSRLRGMEYLIVLPSAILRVLIGTRCRVGRQVAGVDGIVVFRGRAFHQFFLLVLDDIHLLVGYVRTVGCHRTLEQADDARVTVLHQHLRGGVGSTMILIHGREVAWGDHLHVGRVSASDELMDAAFPVVGHIFHVAIGHILSFLVDTCDIKLEALCHLSVVVHLDGLTLVAQYLQVQGVVVLEESCAQHIKDGELTVLVLVEGEVRTYPQTVQSVEQVCSPHQSFLVQLHTVALVHEV